MVDLLRLGLPGMSLVVPEGLVVVLMVVALAVAVVVVRPKLLTVVSHSLWLLEWWEHSVCS